MTKGRAAADSAEYAQQRPARRPRRAVYKRSPVDYDRQAESRRSVLNEINDADNPAKTTGDDRMMIDDDPAVIDEPMDELEFWKQQRPPHYGGD